MNKNSRANDNANLGADKLAETLNDKRADIIVDKMKEDFGPRFKKIIEDPHWACPDKKYGPKYYTHDSHRNMINLMKDFIDIAASNYYFEIKPLAYTAWKKTLNKKSLAAQVQKHLPTHSVKSKTIWIYFKAFLIKSGFYKNDAAIKEATGAIPDTPQSNKLKCTSEVKNVFITNIIKKAKAISDKRMLGFTPKQKEEKMANIGMPPPPNKGGKKTRRRRKKKYKRKKTRKKRKRKTKKKRKRRKKKRSKKKRKYRK